ncbi:cytochrome ubiquinol oxidase subunit I, partial [Streptomyces sp. NPDC001492]
MILVASSECDRRARTGHRRGMRHLKWLTTTDHKTIGTLYLVTSFAFFLIGGVMALLMRAELARPGLQIMSN